MQRIMLRSKIHRATVTRTLLNYEGSITIDPDLLEAADLRPYERVQVLNLSNGHRFETYVIPGERGSGAIVLNGATAHLGKPGDLLTIMSYTEVDAIAAKTWQPQVIVLDEKNAVLTERGI